MSLSRVSPLGESARMVLCIPARLGQGRLGLVATVVSFRSLVVGLLLSFGAAPQAISCSGHATPSSGDSFIRADVDVRVDVDMDVDVASSVLDSHDARAVLTVYPPSSPIEIDGDGLLWGDSRTVSVQLANSTERDVIVGDVELRYAVDNPPVEGVDGAALSIVSSLGSGVLLRPGDSVAVDIRYIKLDAQERRAELVVATSVPTPSELAIGVVARPGFSGGTEVDLVPAELDFGFVYPGDDRVRQATTHVAGSAARIRWAAFEPDPSRLFSVEVSGSAEWQPGLPAIVRSETPGVVRVRYSPRQEHASGVGEMPSADEAVLILAANTSTGFLRIPVRGTPTSTCPVPLIVVLEEEPHYFVIGQPVHLIGAHSYSPLRPEGIEVMHWSWRLDEEPEGSSVTIEPSTHYPNIVMTPIVPGKYDFELDVEDSRGVSSCRSARYVLHVGPDG